MSVKVALEHRTTYEFDAAGDGGAARGPAAPGAAQPDADRGLLAGGHAEDHFLNWQQDPFGNWLARLVFPEKTDRLEITVGLVADLMVDQPVRLLRRGVRRAASRSPTSRRSPPTWRRTSAPVDEQPRPPSRGGRRCRPLPDEGIRTVDFLAEPQRRRSTATSPTTCGWSPACRRRTRRCSAGIGSCRDSAWLLVSLLRQYGLAARFVSGYLVQLAADQVVELDGPAGPTEDFTDLHAWAEVFVPGAGWIGLDPTSACSPARATSRSRATPHPSSAAPIEGATDPVEVTFSFANAGHPDPRGPAGHQALHRRGSGPASTPSARRSTPRLQAGDVG